jgi:ElaB/YqjD/DUF883 family membrane-anchored ribosome-binding protein
MPAAAAAETPAAEPKARIPDRVADTLRRVAHASHEARLFKSVAQDAIEDGAYAARRALKTARRRVDELGDVKNEVIHRVRRQPVQAIGIAFAAGIVAGAVVGWIAHPAPRSR